MVTAVMVLLLLLSFVVLAFKMPPQMRDDVPETSILPESQQCVRFPEGEPVPGTLEYEEGFWTFNGEKLTYSKSEDLEFVICANIFMMQAIMEG